MSDAQDSLFDIVIYAIDPDAENFEQARAKVAHLLKLPESEVDDALLFGSRVVASGIDESLARAHFGELQSLGVNCSLRPSIQSGRTLTLEPMSLEREYECPRCGHEHVYQRDDPPPPQCNSCGLVFAKFEKVEAEKREREAMRAKLLAQRDELSALEEEDRREREAAERRARMEEELRKELGIPRVMASRKALLATAAGVLALGIGVGVGAALLLAKLRGDDTTEVAQAPATAEQGTAALDQKDPGFGAHAVLAELEAKPSRDAAQPGDLASVAPTHATPQGTLEALQRDALYQQQVAAQAETLFAAGNTAQGTQVLETSIDKSAAIRRVSDATARRALTAGSPAAVAPTFEALSSVVEQMPPDSPTRIGDLAHVTRAQISAGLTDAASTQVEKLRQWAAQAAQPDAKARAQGEVGSVLTRLGRQDEAQSVFRDANGALRQVGDRAARLAVVVGLARSYADAGNNGAALMLIEDATSSAGRIADPAKRVAVLRDIATFHAENGNPTAALEVTATIDNPALRADVELALTDALIAAAKLAAATEVADAITPPEYRARAFGRLSRAQHASRTALFRDLAPKSLVLARGEIDRVAAPHDQAMILSELARIAVQIEQAPVAASWFADAERLAAGVAEAPLRQAVYGVIAGNMGRADRIADAQRVAALVGDPTATAGITDDIARVQRVVQLASVQPAAAPPGTPAAPAAAAAAATGAAAPGIAAAAAPPSAAVRPATPHAPAR